MVAKINDGYLGNNLVKRAGVETKYTDEELQEYIKCSNDPVHFIESYCSIISLDEGLVKFKLRGYQENLIRHYDDNRFNVVLASRQSGKSITSCAYLLWYLLFNPEVTVAVLANKGVIAREMISRIVTMLESVPFFLQPGVKILNKGNIEFGNDSKVVAAATSSSSIRGLSINLLYLDEFAFVENAEEFYTSTYPVVTSGKQSKVIITSTANGVGNMFYKIYESAIQKQSEYKHFLINWFDVPGRDEEWKKQTIANTSETQFEQEYGNSFLGTGTTLINSNTLLGMRSIDPDWSRDNINIYDRPVEGHEYVCTVDVSQGRGIDYSTFSIFDVSVQPFKQVATYRDNMISPMLLPDVINKYAHPYNDALVIIENNAEGSLVAKMLHYDVEYESVFVQGMSKAEDIGVTMNRKIKRIGCSTLKELLEENRLTLIDRTTITELMTFVHKGTSYEADRGYHDDMVMNCVLFSWFITTPYFEHLTDKAVKTLLYSEQQKLIEDDLLPAGVFGALEGREDTFVDVEGDRWYVDSSS
ncbi:terminase family protein [bacterium]|nr:terminase family protein [bacterium]